MGWVEDRSKEPGAEGTDEIGGQAGYPYGPPPELVREVNASGTVVIKSRKPPVDEEARQSLQRKLERYLARSRASDASGQNAGEPEEDDSIQPQDAPPPAPKPEPVPLRGELFQPDAPGLYPFSRPTSELKLSRENVLPRDGETHLLLNAIIGECHFLMREVTFRSLCRSTELEDRMTWLNATMKLAETGARVGDSVARLMNGPEIRHTQHTQMIQHGYMEVKNPKPAGRKSSAKKVGKGGGRGRASP